MDGVCPSSAPTKPVARRTCFVASCIHLLLAAPTQPGHWAPLPASPGHKVRFPTAFLDSCVFIAHCGELIWVGKSSKCSVLQAGALRKVKDGKVAPWWWWGVGVGRCLAVGPPKGGARKGGSPKSLPSPGWGVPPLPPSSGGSSYLVGV